MKLHGDYQSVQLKNTTTELQEQDAALRSVFVGACNRFRMIVLGYSGRDTSVMTTLRDALSGPSPFPAGIRWVVRSGGSPLASVISSSTLPIRRASMPSSWSQRRLMAARPTLTGRWRFRDEARCPRRDARPSFVVQPVALPTAEGSPFPVLRCFGSSGASVPEARPTVDAVTTDDYPKRRAAALKAARVPGIAAASRAGTDGLRGR